MKCQNLFSGKTKKNISICRLKILPRMLSVELCQVKMGVRVSTVAPEIRDIQRNCFSYFSMKLL